MRCVSCQVALPLFFFLLSRSGCETLGSNTDRESKIKRTKAKFVTMEMNYCIRGLLRSGEESPGALVADGHMGLDKDPAKQNSGTAPHPTTHMELLKARFISGVGTL